MQPLIVYCQSLGGVICARAISEFEGQDKIDLLVLDSTFASYKDIAYLKLKEHWLTYLLSPIAEFLVSDEKASRDHLHSLKMQKIVFHSEADAIIPISQGEEVFRLLNEPKDFVRLMKENHIETFKEKKTREQFLEQLKNIKASLWHN